MFADRLLSAKSKTPESSVLSDGQLLFSSLLSVRLSSGRSNRCRVLVGVFLGFELDLLRSSLSSACRAKCVSSVSVSESDLSLNKRWL